MLVRKPRLRRRLSGLPAFVATAWVLLAVIVVVAILAGVLAPYDPNFQDLLARRQPPSAAHWLGTDDLGRDVLSRMIFGARATSFASVVAVGISAVIGVPLGLFAGSRGGAVEASIMAGIEVLQAFPGFLLAIVVVAAIGPSLTNAAIAVGIAGVAAFTRVVRGSVLSVRNADYVQAAIGMGAGRLKIMFRYILPNVAAPILVLTMLSLGTAVLTVAGLSFLGLGAQPPTAEWGVMVRDGQDYLRDIPFLTIWPGLAVMVLVVSVNVIGDWLEQRLNRRRRESTTS